MSRKEEKMNNRCSICGGRMRLVNVTWVNTFQTPEAEQYDLSVSRRKTSRKKAAAATASQELMCASCCRRIPLADEKGKVTKKTVKKAKKQEKKEKKNKKKRGGSVFGTILLLAILATLVYLVYTYFDAIVAFLQPAIDFVTGLFQK